MTLKIFCQKWNKFCTTAYNILKTPKGVEGTMLIHNIIISFNFSHFCIDCYSITLEKRVYPSGYWFIGGKCSGIFSKLLLIMKYPVNIQGNSVRDLFETGENFTRRKFSQEETIACMIHSFSLYRSVRYKQRHTSNIKEEAGQKPASSLFI